jgi:hypothetical protein
MAVQKECDMKIIIKISIWVALVVYLAFCAGCGAPAQKPTVEPTPPPPPKVEPTIEDLRKHVDKDPDMFKAIKVIEKYGVLRKKAITFEKYVELTKGQSGGALNPDWFSDSYTLEVNENKHWVTFTLGTAKRVREKDARIQQVMAGLPEESISLKMQTPDGKKYILSDAEADGVLDYAAPVGQKTLKVDIPLLDNMQEKYTWLLGIVKQNYRLIKK